MRFSISLILLAVTTAVHSMDISSTQGDTIEAIWTHSDGSLSTWWQPVRAGPEAIAIINKAKDEDILETLGQIAIEVKKDGLFKVMVLGMSYKEDPLTNALWEDWRAGHKLTPDRLDKIERRHRIMFMRWKKWLNDRQYTIPFVNS
ncbi:hypothetical protein BC835DRAFT_1391417 [Cytidiella melzeri]|nr:hypothetical protein BC835DRAFT_1391417 [Cytidiella melzeri]